MFYELKPHDSAKIHVAIHKALGIVHPNQSSQAQSKAAWAELLANAHTDNGARLNRCASIAAELKLLANEQFGNREVFAFRSEDVADEFDITLEDAGTAIRLAGAVERDGHWLSDTSGPPRRYLAVRKQRTVD